MLEPRDSTTNSKVVTLAKSEGVTSFWIGVNDITIEDVFTYESNGKTIDYKNWNTNPKEPNNGSNQKPNEDCVAIWKTDNYNGKWNDYYCTSRLSFVCE